MRTLKEQCLYLHRFTSLTEARAIIGEFARYNAEWLTSGSAIAHLRPRGPRRWRSDHGHPRNAIAPGRQDRRSSSEPYRDIPL
jgi:hypothetical protein